MRVNPKRSMVRHNVLKAAVVGTASTLKREAVFRINLRDAICRK